MARFRKDRNSQSSEQESLERSKNWLKQLQPSDLEESPPSQLKSSKQNWDENPAEVIREAKKYLKENHSYRIPMYSEAENSELLSSADSLEYNLRMMDEYFAPIKEAIMANQFDPFRANPEYQQRVNALMAKMRVKAAGTYPPPIVQLRDEEFDQIVDPLSRMLQKNQRKFIEDLTDYLDPYSVAISLEKNQINGKSHFLLKLGIRTPAGVINQVASKKLTFEEAGKLNGDVGVFRVFDEMVREWEGRSNRTYGRKMMERLVTRQREAAQRGHFPSWESDGERIFFENHLQLKDGQLVPKPWDSQTIINQNKASTPKKKELLLCPDHGNPMMRKKSDPDHLYCPAVGCKNVLKRRSGEAPKVEPAPNMKETIDKLQEAGKKLVEAFSVPPGSVNQPEVEPQNNTVHGYLSTDPAERNDRGVWVHVENGRTYLRQEILDGSFMQIDVTDYTLGVNFDQQGMANVQSFNQQFPVYVPAGLPPTATLMLTGLTVQ